MGLELLWGGEAEWLGIRFCVSLLLSFLEDETKAMTDERLGQTDHPNKELKQKDSRVGLGGRP